MTPDIRPLSVAPISMATLEGIDANPDWATILDQLSPPHTPRTSLAPCPAARDARPAPARSTVHDGVPLPPRSHGKALCEARRVDEGAGRQHTGSQTRPVQLSVHSLGLLQRPTDNASVGPSEAVATQLGWRRARARTALHRRGWCFGQGQGRQWGPDRGERRASRASSRALGVCAKSAAPWVCLGFGDGEFGTEDLTPPTRGRGFPGDRAGNWLDPPASRIATLGSTSWNRKTTKIDEDKSVSQDNIWPHLATAPLTFLIRHTMSHSDPNAPAAALPSNADAEPDPDAEDGEPPPLISLDVVLYTAPPAPPPAPPAPPRARATWVYTPVGISHGGGHIYPPQRPLRGRGGPYLPESIGPGEHFRGGRLVRRSEPSAATLQHLNYWEEFLANPAFVPIDRYTLAHWAQGQETRRWNARQATLTALAVPINYGPAQSWVLGTHGEQGATEQQASEQSD
ncbi:hypothetical protein DFH06DRAFT_1153161 [Mycena polygramma]|nr:hypothetical protein DFH06DRAFT_1153161 [Mycena polygramma]